VAIYLIILIAIGVVGNQPRRYYAHILAAVAAWIVLMPSALWLSSKMDPAAWGVLDFLLTGAAWAIPIVIIASGYERKDIYRLIPRRRPTTGN